MATLEEVADRAQNAINDANAGTWSQTIIEEWVCEGIRDYNSYFHRTTEDSYPITSNASTLSLGNLVREVISVEYPTGDSPPTYLNRLSRYHPDFYKRDDNYDFEPVNEWGESVLLSAGTAPYLVFSSDVASGETVTVTTRSIHDPALLNSELVTVPDEHQHLLILFVLWKAHSERTISEAQDPDTTIRMIHQMKLAAQAAEQDYRRAVAATQEMAALGGWVIPWKVDDYDRIY